MKASIPIILFPFMALSMVMLSCGESPSDLVIRGGELYRVGQHDEAIQTYTKALKLDPNFAMAYYNRGHARLGTGRPDLAESDYREALRLNPNLPDPYSNLASHYYKRANARLEAERLELAGFDYRNALRLNPNLPDPYSTLGTYYNTRANVHLDEERPVEAEADYKRALQFNPDLPDPYNNLGTFYYTRANAHLAVERSKAAEADYKKALQFNPDLPDPSSKVAVYYYNSGKSYMEKQEYLLARYNLRQAVRLSPSNSAYKAELREVGIRMGRLRASEAPQRTSTTSAVRTPASKSGIGVSRNTIVRAMEEAGFTFNSVSRYGNREVVYGESTVQTSGGSIATLELTGPSNDIENAYFKVFDVPEAPQLGAVYILTFMELVLPDWRDGPNWLAGATKRAIAGDEAATRVKGPGGDVYVDVKNNGMTMIIEVSNRGIVDYADQILNSP